MQWLGKKSRVSREAHARIREHLTGEFLWVTRLVNYSHRIMNLQQTL